jgi:hypothetical protein
MNNKILALGLRATDDYYFWLAAAGIARLQRGVELDGFLLDWNAAGQVAQHPLLVKTATALEPISLLPAAVGDQSVLWLDVAADEFVAWLTGRAENGPPWRLHRANVYFAWSGSVKPDERSRAALLWRLYQKAAAG